MDEDAPFRAWARALIDGVVDRLVASIPGASAGSPSSLKGGYESRYVHFTDAKLPQPLCVWVYSSLAGADNNFPGSGDVVGVGLKHDADHELDSGAWRFRLSGSRFRWREHCDTRYAGYRFVEPADPLRSQETEVAIDVLTRAVVTQLRRAEAL